MADSEKVNSLPLIPARDASAITRAGQAANQAAADYLFADYRQRRAKKTIRTQTAALLLWVHYLADVKAAGELLAEAETWAAAYFGDQEQDELLTYAEAQCVSLPIVHGAYYCQHVPAAWQGVTWGLVEGFVKWLLNQGYSLASVNNRLSAVKVYVRLAAKAGMISPTEQALIREVRGYGRTEGKRVDEGREQTRVGHKKEEAVVLTAVQARQLKTQHPPTPQGIRDRLLLCLLLDLGLRASEVAALTVEDLAEPGYVTVYRQKTDTTDRMELSADLLAALSDYRRFQRPAGPLLRGSRKNGELTVTAQFALGEPPLITSPDNAMFEMGVMTTFTVTASGLPTPTISLSGTLPAGVAFTDLGNGTAVLSGAAEPGTAGIYALIFSASNLMPPDDSQAFTLTVPQAPTITSPDETAFAVGVMGSFTVTAVGVPTPTLSYSGDLPAGLTFSDNGDGTATLSGATDAEGVYELLLTATNGILPDATQTLTLTVTRAPLITSAAAATFVAGQMGSFTVTAVGVPTPTLSYSGTLPAGVTFSDNGNGIATLSGVPVAGGVYSLTITASNGVLPDGTQTFMLTVLNHLYLPLVINAQ